MYMIKLKTTDEKNILINPKDVRWVKEEQSSARIEFMSGEQVVVKCDDFDDLEQKILDASLPEIDIKTLDGITVYVKKEGE